MENRNYKLLPIEGIPELKVRCYRPEKLLKGIIILVHGVSHGAWCWKNYVEYFTANGYACFALNLRGHGDDSKKNIKGAKLSKYVSDVKRCVDGCEELCRKEKIPYSKPLIIGHSMGGAIVQKYISKNSDDVQGAILVAAVTAGGMGLRQIIKTTFSQCGRSTISTILGCKKRRHMPNANFFVAVHDDVIMNRISNKEDIRYYQNELYRESLRAMFGLYRYRIDGGIDIPILVIGSKADAYFPEPSLRKTAECYGCTEHNEKHKLVIMDDLCHDMMLDPDWETSAEQILGFMENNASHNM